MEFTNFIPQAPLGYINRQNLSLENINQKKKKTLREKYCPLQGFNKLYKAEY